MCAKLYWKRTKSSSIYVLFFRKFKFIVSRFDRIKIVINLHFRHGIVLGRVSGSLLGYLDRPVSQYSIPYGPPGDVSRPVRPPLHLPLHLHFSFIFRRYPRGGRAHLLATNKLILRQIWRLEVAVRLGLSRTAGFPRREVPAIERLLEQLLLQQHRLLQVRYVRIHGIGRQRIGVHRLVAISIMI